MTDINSVAAIHDRIEALAALVGAPADLLPERTERGRDGTLWIYEAGAPSTYGMLYFDHGSTVVVAASATVDEVVSQVMDGITFSMAVREAKTLEKPDGDARIPVFAIQQRLMDQIDPDWAAVLRANHARALVEQPPVLAR